MIKESDTRKLTFGEHLDELRKVLAKVACIIVAFMILVFCFKDDVFKFLLGPCETNFATFDILRKLLSYINGDVRIFPDNIELITTDISSQFMAHLSVSFYLGIMLASPYIIYELMRYVAPGLYDEEKKYAYRVLISVYLLFFLGMVISYWVLFPISCRFLASYSVSPDVKTLISLDSYMSLFISLTILMGVVFQLPVLAISMAKMGLIDSQMMTKYRRHTFIFIVVIAAIITPPDILTLIIVTMPLYVLYEASIVGVKVLNRKQTKSLKLEH